MAWLRIDDRFTEHRKIISLRRADRWTWLELLAYCARHGSGHVPGNIADVLRYVTPALVERFVELRLLDPNADGSFEVHDWAIYNAQTVEDRVAAYLQSDPQATANEVHRAIGGKRDVVLRTVATMRGDTSEPGSQGTGAGGSRAGSPAVPLARARGPHPTPPLGTPTAEGSETPTPTPAGQASHDDAKPEELNLTRLEQAGWTKTQLADVLRNDGLDRALAWLTHAEADPSTRNPGGLAWSGYASNVWPPEQRLEVAPGAMGTRSTVPVYEHVCPRCPGSPPTSFKTEQRLVEHLEVVHDEYRSNGAAAGADLEPVVNIEERADT